MIMTMHKVSTTWEVPERYLNLSPVGSGAFGQVSIIGIMKMTSPHPRQIVQVCSATDTERRSENGGDVRVAIKKIARPFQVRN